MNEIFFAFKCIILFFVSICIIFFATYFISANDHIVTVYLNPIYFNSFFYGTSPEFQMPLWLFSFISIGVGGGLVRIIDQITLFKQQTKIDNLTKENTGLKSKFDKVKTDISKCVT